MPWHTAALQGTVQWPQASLIDSREWGQCVCVKAMLGSQTLISLVWPASVSPQCYKRTLLHSDILILNPARGTSQPNPSLMLADLSVWRKHFGDSTSYSVLFNTKAFRDFSSRENFDWQQHHFSSSKHTVQLNSPFWLFNFLLFGHFAPHNQV